MSLPGKLCIGILEEDNPLRSYFRFKPLLLDEGGKYIPFEECDQYPNEGCIRIVPDKNESYHFKARMRQMGLFCVVDLREHPNENDKIRPNKNYRPEGEEINACIIYSDVVRTPAPGMIFEVLPAAAAEGPVRTPRTGMALLERDGAVDATCYTWEPAGEGMAALRATPAVCPTEGLQVFELPGFGTEALRFAIRPAGEMDEVCDMPERAERRVERAEPERPVAQRPAPQPETVVPAETEVPVKPESSVQPVESAQPAAAEEPAPQAGTAVEEKAVDTAAAGHPAPRPPRHPEPEAPRAAKAPADKPWIHRDSSMLPRPVDRRLSRAEQLRAAQEGLNPRRGRSLQELIDEKWQHSRLNQLGMTAAPIVTGAPVRNPVDAAVEAVKEVWSQPGLRGSLMDALSGVDDFTYTLNKYREQAGLELVEAQLNGLEAQRLELLGELDKLKAGGQSLREQLKQEIRRDEAEALADATEKTRIAQAEQAKYERLADDARAAAKDARGLLDTLMGDQLEQKIRDVALIRRVEERLALLRGAPEGDSIPAAPKRIDIYTFIERLTRRFAAEGWALSSLDAANLSVCFILGPTLTLSGAPGSGKTTAARMLADALGISASGRLAICPPEPGNALRDARVERLRRDPGIPAAVILDDANLHPHPDMLRGLGQVFDPEWRTVLTVQDTHSGAPLNAATLDRGFLVRLSAPKDLPWKPAAGQPAGEFSLVSIQAIRAALPQATVSSAIESRMEQLRAALARRGVQISRRALDDAWRYCAAMTALLSGEVTSEQVFDLAVAQRILPGLLASAPIEAAMELRRMTENMPLCRRLLGQPLPIALG